MLRYLRLAALVVFAVAGADLIFRASILRLVRPVIVEPADGELVAAPVRVRWEGPQRMRVTLRYAGREKWDLGLRESPFVIPKENLRERGLYSVEIRALTLGEWITATRAFSTDGDPPAMANQQHDEVSRKLAALEESLQEMRDTQEDSHEENTNLYEENASIREENAILTEEIQQMAESEQRANSEITGLNNEYARLAGENRMLMDEVAQLRTRLGAVVPCSVWGYYADPRPQMVPPRRFVVVSDPNGEVFRVQSACERLRRTDLGSASVCFCVGSSFAD